RVQHTLVLIHPDGSQAPTGTSRWLAPRHVPRHYHLRWDTDTDVTIPCPSWRWPRAGGPRKSYKASLVTPISRICGCPISVSPLIGPGRRGSLTAPGPYGKASVPVGACQGSCRLSLTRGTGWSMVLCSTTYRSM